MKEKANILVLTIIMLISSVSCGSVKDGDNLKNSAEIFNNYYYVRMDEQIIYREGDAPHILDCETMNTAILCNIPNCSHKSSDCLLRNLSIDEQLPIIYNNSAYYFQNSISTIDNGGKRELDLNCKLKKYSLTDNTFSDVAKIANYNINLNGGSYLIGSEYYFTTNNGNPEYDDLGNVVSYNSGGGGNLFSVNLDNGEVTDYGPVFDYESLKNEYPSIRNSFSMCLMGKIDNKLYISVNYMKMSITPEMMQNGEPPIWSGETYIFDINSHKIEKLDDEFSMCSMNNYHSYFTNGQNTLLTLQNVKTGEIFNGPNINSWNAMTIFDDKVWHDDAKCYNIKTGEEMKVSSYDYGYVIAKYKDSYIFKGNDDKEKIVFEKIPCEEIDKLFE
ncbi:MAG: hypothetical protein ACI4JE_08720 [Ruminococcus sp.]